MRAQEEQFRTMAESTIDAIVVIDNTGKIQYCNKSVEKIYGYTSEELIGKSIKVIELPPIRRVSRKKRKAYKEETQPSYGYL
mgnify:CR=1 FL=1